jgi:oligoendopeptidase F
MKNKKVLVFMLTCLFIITTALIACESNDSVNQTNNISKSEANNLSETSDENLTKDDNNTNLQAEEDEPTDIEEPLEDGVYNRSEVPDYYKWDLSKFYTGTEDFMLDLSQAESLVATLDRSKNTFTDSYNNFISTLEVYESASRVVNKLYVFATLQAHTDTSNSKYTELEDLASEISSDLSEKASFVLPGIANLDENTMNTYLKNTTIEPYINFINSVLESKDYILSDSEERILGQAQVLFKTPESIYEAYKYNTDLSEYLSQPNWDNFWTGSREEKQQVMIDYYEKTTLGIDLIAEIYESEIKKNSFFAKARHYDSALESALDTDGFTIDAYNTVFEITHENIDLLHRWIDLKKEILNIETPLNMADLYAPLIENPYAFMNYEQAQDYIYKALKPLGNEYISDLKTAFNSRWADVFPTKNKYEGGYQWGTYDTDPFVLLNFNGLMTDVSTAAHEMGHALNFKYSNENQSFFDAGISIFNAEIASTTNEALVFEYRLENSTTKVEKQQALLDYIALIENTIFTQMMYADFEKQAYEKYDAGVPLNALVFNEIMASIYELYYGPNYNVDEISTYQWAEIPHFYNAFYVYKYATGLSAGLAFSDLILNGDDSDRDAYLKFLSSGSSQPPLDLLKEAGVDFSTGQPLQNAFDRFEMLLDAFEDTL